MLRSPLIFKMEHLKEIHEKVKNHPFRLNHSDWIGFYELLKELDKEFTKELDIKFNKNYGIEWDYFIHELRSAIWHFKFEFNENIDDSDRLGLNSEENIKKGYGIIDYEKRKEVIIALESYIQQIHHFIDTNGVFEEYTTYYFGCEDEEMIRWNKYKLNKEKGCFEFVGKIK
jgi:hypothetical protein